MFVLKQEVIDELKQKRENEVMRNQDNRRSSRIRRDQNTDVSEDAEGNTIAFLVLINMCRKFREDHKDDLHLYQALEVDQNSTSYYKNSTNGKDGTKGSPNMGKRKLKEAQKQLEVQEEANSIPVPEPLQKEISFSDNFPVKNEKSEIPVRPIKKLPERILNMCSSMKKSDGGDPDNDNDRKDLKFEFFANSPKPKIAPNVSSPNSLARGMFGRDFNFSNSFSKQFGVFRNENISQTFNFFNVDPSNSIPYDNMKLLPNCSNYAPNMLPKA